MAVLRAYQATDMRLDLWGGIVVERGFREIVATDGAHVSSYGGTFSFPGSGLVSGTGSWYSYGDPFGLGPVSGTLNSYRQDFGFFRQFSIERLAVPAGPLFTAIRHGDTDLASALVFSGADQLTGSRDRDVLLGFSGADMLSGLDGGDLLDGGRGADILRGGDGADLLIGGEGRDHQFGGGGDDTFRFRAVSDSPAGAVHRDVIGDFTHDADHLDLRRIDADATEPGRQSFTYIGSAPFTDSPGELRYSRSSQVVSGDTDGDGKADFQIVLSGGPVLSHHDLLL